MILTLLGKIIKLNIVRVLMEKKIVLDGRLNLRNILNPATFNLDTSHYSYPAIGHGSVADR